MNRVARVSQNKIVEKRAGALHGLCSYPCAARSQVFRPNFRQELLQGAHEGGLSVIDSIVIANIHKSVFKAIAGSAPPTELVSLGVIESFSVASLIQAADTAVKSANVELLEIRLAMALGGKAFVTMTGEVADVRAAVESGAAAVAEKGMLVNKVVIPAPRPELFKDYI